MPSAPETPPLLTISAFARAVDLAPSTLRFYDECGLFLLTEVDSRTGYRYYAPDLERRANLVRRMREIGLPAEIMRHVLDGPRGRDLWFPPNRGGLRYAASRSGAAVFS